MKKNSLLSVMAIMMVIMMSVSFTACSSDDDNNGGGSNSVTKHIVGTWINGGMIVSFYNNGTGFIENSSNTSKFPNGSFKYGSPYEVETEKEETWFFIKATCTSDDYKGKIIEWEIGYKLNDDGSTKWINIEGTMFYEK